MSLSKEIKLTQNWSLCFPPSTYFQIFLVLRKFVLQKWQNRTRSYPKLGSQKGILGRSPITYFHCQLYLAKNTNAIDSSSYCKYKKKKDKGLELWIWHQVFWSKKRNPLGLGTGKVKKSRQDNLYIAKCCKDKVLPGTKILPKDDGFGHPWCPVETSQLQLADVASRLRTLGKSFHPSSHQFQNG